MLWYVYSDYPAGRDTVLGSGVTNDTRYIDKTVLNQDSSDSIPIL